MKRLAMPYVETESDIRHDCANVLRRLGYKVYCTSDSRKARNTKGLPDMFAYKFGKWIAFEFKTSTGKLSDEQQELVNCGASYVIRSVDDLLKLFTESFNIGETVQ
jgi:hypothetical protein